MKSHEGLMRRHIQTSKRRLLLFFTLVACLVGVSWDISWYPVSTCGESSYEVLVSRLSWETHETSHAIDHTWPKKVTWDHETKVCLMRDSLVARETWTNHASPSRYLHSLVHHLQYPCHIISRPPPPSSWLSPLQLLSSTIRQPPHPFQRVAHMIWLSLLMYAFRYFCENQRSSHPHLCFSTYDTTRQSICWPSAVGPTPSDTNIFGGCTH